MRTTSANEGRRSSFARALRTFIGLSLFGLAGCGTEPAVESQSTSEIEVSAEHLHAANPQSSASPPSSNAQACGTGSECASGFCVDGVCCDSACAGTCVACTAAKKGGGDDGTCGSIAYDTDPEEECWGGACDGNGTCKQYNGVACGTTADCLSSYCVDGFCCGNVCSGACQSCSAAKKGSGYDGVCGAVNAGTDPDDECGAGACNESGSCSSLRPNGSSCTSNAQCALGSCADGVCCDRACDNSCEACTAAKKGSGADGTCGPIKYDTDPDNECWGGACNGQYSCGYYNGVACSTAGTCLSNYCVDGVCCNNLCNGTCQACSKAKKGSGFNGVCGVVQANTDPDDECSPGECTGALSCNAPQTAQANGTKCASSAQCSSGFCVDRVCCESACTDGCMACSSAKKGSGTDGTCGLIAYDTDPDEECWGGACNGQGVCQQYNGVRCTSTAECLSNYCVDGFCCGNICNTECMACSTAKKGSGYNGACGSIANLTDPDGECGGGVCDGAGACAPLAIDGTTCNAGAECASGFCVDGVCCDTACTASCKACNLAGLEGTCSETSPGACPLWCADGMLGFPGLPSLPVEYGLSVGTADLNGDGKVDVVLPGNDLSATTVRVLLNNGNGTFAPDVNYPTATFPGNILMADFNVDGHPDIASCGGNDGFLSVLLNQGDGTFGPYSGYNGGQFPSGPRAADLNGDGKPDLVVLNEYNNLVQVLINLGNGTFGGKTGYFAGERPTSIALADFNGDGKIDIAANSLNQNLVRIFFNQGNGTFPTSVDHPLYQRPTGLSATDFNNDGVADLAISHDGFVGPNPSPVTVLLGNGNGSFTSSLYPAGLGSQNVLTGDFNGDGYIDLATLNQSSLLVFLNQGNGTFGTFTSYPHTVAGTGASVADLDGDSHLDFFVTTYYATAIVTGNGDGTFNARKSYGTGTQPTAIVQADFNGDGLRDVATANRKSNNVSVRLNGGAGTFAPRVDYPTAADPFDLEATDLNGDGFVDLVTANYNDGTASILLGNGNGTFAPKIDLTMGNKPRSITAGDMNGDGRRDLVTAYQGSEEVGIFYQQSNGTFANQAKIPMPLYEYPKAVVVADFNADGRLDIAAYKNSSSVMILLNAGNGVFNQLQYYANAYGDAMVAKDLDNDGFVDLAVAGYGSLGVLRNQGNGTFASTTMYWTAPYTSGRSIVAEDMNADGKVDLAIGDSGVVLLLNQGNAVFGPGTKFPAGASNGYYGLVAADFDGDGQPDFATAESGSNTVSILLNRCLP